MKLLKFVADGQERFGRLEGENRIVELDGNFFDDSKETGGVFSLDEVILLPPTRPSKIICIGLNYRDHARELNLPLPGEPVLFMKPSTTVIGHGDSIVYPQMSRQVDYEAELAVIIKNILRHKEPEDVRKGILGYTCANDITARDLQKKDGQWTRAKSFDTFLPLGPWIETELDPDNLKIELYQNGALRQSSNTDQMIFPVFQLVSFISKIMTLFPGDVIITGTPHGIGPVRPGDVLEVVVEGIGTLRNSVVEEKIQ